ncbi:hypothetical protein [Bartonella sp. LJL80]
MGSYLHTYHKGHKLYYAGFFDGKVHVEPNKEDAIHYLNTDAARLAAVDLAYDAKRSDFQVETNSHD